MSAPKRSMKGPRHLGGRVLAIFAIMASMCVGIAGARVTYALWESDASVKGGIVTAGDLGVSIDSVAWTSQGISGTLNDLSTAVFAAGSPVILRVEVSAVTSGDNLAVALDVAWAGGQALTMSWHVEENGTRVTPLFGEAAIDARLTIPGSTTTNRTWIVVITVMMPTGAWVDPTAAASTTPVDMGSLTISAHQVRCGDDFAAQCS